MIDELPEQARLLDYERITHFSEPESTNKIPAILYHGRRKEYHYSKEKDGFWIPGGAMVQTTPDLTWAIQFSLSRAQGYRSEPSLFVIDTREQMRYLHDGVQFSHIVCFERLNTAHFRQLDIEYEPGDLSNIVTKEDAERIMQANRRRVEEVVKDILKLPREIPWEQIAHLESVYEGKY